MDANSRYEEYRSESIFFVVTGPSGVGKTTVMERLLEGDDRLTYSISHTTREARPDETHGEDYYFVGESEFENLQEKDGFLEWAEIYGDYYGTSRQEVAKIRKKGLDPFLDIDVQGAAQLRNDPELEAVFIFLAPPSLEELKRRITGRGAESSETIRKRLRVAEEEINRIREFDYLVVNEDLDETLSLLGSVVKAERLKV
jgi:guanylate kinase